MEAVAQQQMTGEQFVEVLKALFQITIMGVIAKFPGVPPQVMTPSMCEAFARVISEATLTSNVKATLAMRGSAQTAFGTGLKKTPALMASSAIPESAQAN